MNSEKKNTLYRENSAGGYEALEKSVHYIRNKTKFVPSVAIVLGSGLGALADEIKQETIVEYSEIEGFPVSTVAGHAGRFIFGYIGNVKVVIMQGRVHYYEGYSMKEVIAPIRILKMLGAETLILTNAAGGIGPELEEGDLMLIKDHISSFVLSPLIGPNADELGVRFPDMTSIYDEGIRAKVLEIADREEICIKEGVYIQLTGPNYETPAEIKLYKMLGANAVGMSTACEAMAARHMRMKVCGISCITNMAAGMGSKELSHMDVTVTADRVAENFKTLIRKIVVEL